MRRRAQPRDHWPKAKFRCVLLAAGLKPFRRPGQEGLEVARVNRLRPGAMALRIGPSSLSLGHGQREMLGIPIRNLSRVEVIPFSVNMQLLGLLSGTLRTATWLGAAKGAFLVLSTLVFMDDPRVQIPYLLNHLPYLFIHLALLVPAGLLLDVPFRLLPGAWKIEGPMWRLRFEAMDGRAFNLLVGRQLLDTLVHLLRKTGLMVYVHPGRLTRLDRGWAVRGWCAAAIRRFCKEMF